MQCKKCGYEPTLAEIQAGQDECPGCIDKAEQANRKAKSNAHAITSRPQEVVIVDFDMNFHTMVRFMVKWAFAAIPALIIIFLVPIGLVITIGTFLGYVGKH